MFTCMLFQGLKKTGLILYILRHIKTILIEVSWKIFLIKSKNIMIGDKLQTMIGEAMKAHDEVRTSTLRLLSSAFNYERIEKQHDLTEEEEIAVIRKTSQTKERFNRGI